MGEIMELSSMDELIRSPKHPYSQALFKAVPVPDHQPLFTISSRL